MPVEFFWLRQQSNWASLHKMWAGAHLLVQFHTVKYLGPQVLYCKLGVSNEFLSSQVEPGGHGQEQQ